MPQTIQTRSYLGLGETGPLAASEARIKRLSSSGLDGHIKRLLP